MSLSPQTAFLVDSKCHQACVARNDVWRDHRRAPSAATRERFRNARTSFHRVVRSQNPVLVGLAKEHYIFVALEPPSCSLPSRTNFSGQSRRDNTHLAGGHSQNLPGQTLWGRNLRVFDKNSHDEVTRRFSALFVGPHDTGGQFNCPFSVVEPVGAESAVGGDVALVSASLGMTFQRCGSCQSSRQETLSSRQLQTCLFGVMSVHMRSATHTFVARSWTSSKAFDTSRVEATMGVVLHGGPWACGR